MTADRLLALYDRVADAPDAVSRLRRFVLDLAVRGKLVEQNLTDEPASELLKRIPSSASPCAASWSSRIRRMNLRRSCCSARRNRLFRRVMRNGALSLFRAIVDYRSTDLRFQVRLDGFGCRWFR